AHPRLYWGETGAFGSPALIELPLPLNLDQSGWGRSLHFLAAWICVLNGSVYVLSGLVSENFGTNLLPVRADITLNRILDRVANGLHWRKPAEKEWTTYNVVQRLTYMFVIFALFPLMIVTGLAMSPAVSAVVPAFPRAFGGYQSSRTVHFLVTNLLIVFVIVHVAMVCLAGFWSRTRLMITGRASKEYMSKSVTRRRFLMSAVAAAAAATGSGAAAVLARRYGLVPPDHGGLFGVGETLTYAAHRVLLSHQPLAREFTRDQISTNFPAINTVMPEDDLYRQDIASGFRQLRLAVAGLM